MLLSADVYTKVSETTEHGYPIREHLNRLVDGEIIWAPAIDGAFVLSTRGGDFDLQLGTDVSIGYLSHDADTVRVVSAGDDDVPVLHRRGVGRTHALALSASVQLTDPRIGYHADELVHFLIERCGGRPEQRLLSLS